MFYVYILQLSNKKYYHGFSTNLKDRYEDHLKGKVAATKNFRPLKLVFYASFLKQEKATDFEKYLKTMSGFAFRNKRLI